MSRDADLTRVQHMAEAAREIQTYVAGRSLATVRSDQPLKHLIIRNLEIMGEAASRVSAEFREEYPDVPWRDMVDLRNRLIHVYFDLDVEIIWATAREDIPVLLPQLEAILDEFAG